MQAIQSSKHLLIRSLLVLVMPLVMVLADSQPAAAQVARGELKNVRGFKFFMTDLSAKSQACGLDQAALQRAFTEPLNEAGLKITTTSTAYWITIRVTTLSYGERSCVSYVDANASQTTRYFNTATLSERVGKVQHWSDGKLLSSNEKEHPVIANNAFHAMGKSLVAAWRRDQ